jgi:hypothetical protein
MVILTFCDGRNSPYTGRHVDCRWRHLDCDLQRVRMRDRARLLRLALHGIGARDTRDYQAANRQSCR